MSGNPTGRPRHSFSGPAEDAILSRVISRKINIAVDGRTRRVSIKEAIAFQLADKAAKGNLGAIKVIMAVPALSVGRREMPAGFEDEFDVLVRRLSGLSDLEEGLVQAGLLFPGADQEMYFKPSVFELAVAETGRKRVRSATRLTTPEIEASKVQVAHKSVFEMFARRFEIMARRSA